MNKNNYDIIEAKVTQLFNKTRNNVFHLQVTSKCPIYCLMYF